MGGEGAIAPLPPRLGRLYVLFSFLTMSSRVSQLQKVSEMWPPCSRFKLQGPSDIEEGRRNKDQPDTTQPMSKYANRVHCC